VNRPITARAVHDSEPLRSGFGQLGYEVIPFKRTREAVLAHVPRQVPLTVTALLRVSGGIGIGESAKFLRKQQSLLWRFFLPGGYQPDKIITGLAPCLGQPDNHLAGFHVFTFNDLGPTEEWRQQSLRRLHQLAGPLASDPAGGKPQPEHT
jgi:hypothetical protein